MRIFCATAAAAVCATAAYAVDTCGAGGCRMPMLRDPDIREMRVAQGQGAPAAEPRPNRSRYRESRQAVFVRGGYAFASGGSGLADGAGAPAYAAGYRVKLKEGSAFSFEGEMIYQKDSDPVTIGVGIEQATVRSITGLSSVRWDGPKLGAFTPFVSGGFGPAHVKSKLDNGVTPLTDSSVELGYGGRIGVAAPLFRNVSVEAGYRYLGATNDDAVKTHSAEIGLAYHF